MANLMSIHQWTGEFFLPEDYENRFVGRLSYSPTEGVVLTYTITGMEVPSGSPILHGVLESGQKCTLVGRFDPKRSGFAFQNGLSTRPGKVGFEFLVLGDFLAAEELVSKLDFTLNHLQDFFYHSGFKLPIRYSSDPVCEIKTEFGSVEFRHAGSFESIAGPIDAQFYSHDKAALDDLTSAIKGVEEKHPKAFFSLRKEFEFRGHLKTSEPLPLRSAYEKIALVSDLFALLFCSPVYAEHINIYKKAQDDYPLVLKVFPSQVIDPRTLKLCNQKFSHSNLPINTHTVSLHDICEAWLNETVRNSTIISSIQHETGFRDEHSAHGEVVLFVTQLESISHAAGISNEKYEYPLRRFSSAKIKDGLCALFGTSELSEVGKGLSGLRNEIAHVGRPRHWLNKLDLGSLVDISQYLQLTIAGHSLASLGVTVEVIHEYQNKNCPRGRVDS